MDGAREYLASSDRRKVIQDDDFQFVLEHLSNHSKPLKIHTFLRLYFSDLYDLGAHLDKFDSCWSKWKELNIETLLVETADADYKLGSKLVRVFDSVSTIKKFGLRSVNLQRYKLQEDELGFELEEDSEIDSGDGSRLGDQTGVDQIIAKLVKLPSLEKPEISGMFPDTGRGYYVWWPAGTSLRSLSAPSGYVKCSTKFEDFDSVKKYEHRKSSRFTKLPTFRNLETLKLDRFDSEKYDIYPSAPKLAKCLENFTTFNTKLVNLVVQDCEQGGPDKLLRRYLSRIQRLELYFSEGWKFESVITNTPRLGHLVYDNSYKRYEDGLPLAFLVPALLEGKVSKDLKTIQFKASAATHRPRADVSLRGLRWAAAQLPDHWPPEAIKTFVGKVVNKPKNMTLIIDVPALMQWAQRYSNL